MAGGAAILDCPVDRAGRIHARAVLDDIARARCRAADSGTRLEHVHRTGVGDTVTDLGDVAAARRRAALTGELQVGSAGGTGTAAEVRLIAHSGRSSALGHDALPIYHF